MGLESSTELLHVLAGLAAAAQCMALRCLEALAVRDNVVQMSGQLLGAILHLPFELLTTAKNHTR